MRGDFLAAKGVSWVRVVISQMCEGISWLRGAFLDCARSFLGCRRRFLGCVRAFLRGKCRFLDCAGAFLDGVDEFIQRMREPQRREGRGESAKKDRGFADFNEEGRKAGSRGLFPAFLPSLFEISHFEQDPASEKSGN